MARVILGIHCGYMHDSSAALVVDGELKAAILQERMSRKKKDPYFPREAILKCLQITGIEPGDVDVVALAAADIRFQPAAQSRDYFQGDGGYFTVHRQLQTSADRLSELLLRGEFKRNQRLGKTPFGDMLEERLRDLGIRNDVRFEYCDHHSCHAASAFCLSGAVRADNGYIFAVDSYGDSKCVTVYRFGPQDTFPIRILEMPAGVSPGLMYSTATKYLGMKPNRHEGKVTGLAGYGDPAVLYEKTAQFLKYNAELRSFEVPCQAEPPTHKLWRRAKMVVGVVSENPYTMDKRMAAVFEGHTKEDIAAAVQQRFDDEIKAFIKDVVGDEAPSCFLLVGGIFANVRTNALIGHMYPTTEIVVHPGMTDEGVAVGAAFYADYKLSGRCTRHPLHDVYYGPGYDPDEIRQFVSTLDPDKYNVEEFGTESTDGERRVAQLVADGKAVGLFQGRMEYGPRALGNRTILADPRDGTVNDWLNARLARTEYMPFAPVIMDEHADDVFDIPAAFRYTCWFMTIIVNVKPEWKERIPGVVHVDGTARPQIIDKQTNPVYHNILDHFRTLTGIPTMINTSFNAHEEPILEHPSQSLHSLDQNCVDCLYLHPFLVSKK